MTLADGGKFGEKEQRWEDEDVDLTASGTVGEDVVVELKLSPDECQEQLQFTLLRGDVPMPSDRYQIQTRGNVVQLTLKQSQKDDAGRYALVARKLSTGLSIPGDERIESRRKIRLSIKDPSQVIEEGEPPIFVRRLSDLAVKVGTRTRFLVEIRSSTSPKITWHKNDEPVQSGSRFSFVHEGNFYCVDVAPVMVDDQGNWTCMAENGAGRSSCTSFLNVIVPKAYKKPEFVDELRALLTETGTVSLECKVVGVPTPVLKWFKDQKEIKAGDVFALTANSDDPTSLGTYTCEAVNCMGTACSSSRVHVVGKGSREGSLKPADALTPSGPLPVFKKILRDEACKIGDSLVLSCQVLVPPWPKTITWYNKEGRVEQSDKYHVIEDGLGGYSIEIKGVEAMDEGEWKCVATSPENMKQFSTCYVAMSIPKNYRIPRFMESLKAVLTEEGLVSFECKVVGFPTPLLRWFKDGQELHPGDVYQLTGTNSLGSYCCIARNCMGEAKSIAELTVEDIQNQLNEEERMQLMSTNQAPKFVKGLRSCEARINEDFTFTIQVSVSPEPSLSWYRDDVPVIESEKYRLAREALGNCHLEVKKLEFMDQAEWKCVAANDFGHSVTSCFLKLVIPKHFKKPKFLESLRAILSEEGAVNLECKVIGVPQPVLKWYKDGVELKPGDIHRIISGQDGTCCLGTYTCEATNCMGSVSSSASLLGFEDRVSIRKEEPKETTPLHELARNLSLSTIHEERTSQLYDTPQTDHSITLDDRGEVSFSFDGKEVSVSLYETPDLTEEEALQIVEMYADQLSEHITEGNVIELPPMRFTKETSTTGNLLMEAVVIDVSPDYFVPDDGDDLRTLADVEDVSIMDDQLQSLRSLSYVSSPTGEIPSDRAPSISGPSRPPRRKESRESERSSRSERSERSEKSLPKGFDWSESYHSAKEPSIQAQSSIQGQDDSGEAFTDALSSSGAGRSKAEESRDLYASFVEQTVERIPLDEVNVEEAIASQIGEALIEQVPVKRKKKKKVGKGSRTPSLSSKASSEESYSPEAEEKGKRRGSKNGREKGERRGSASSNKSTGKTAMRSRSSSESVKFESAASTDRRRRESDATIMVDDIQIEETEEILPVDADDRITPNYSREETEAMDERPASVISTASTLDSEKSMSKTNKDRLLENVYKLSEPVMALRSVLVDLGSLLPLLQTQGSPAEVERSRIEIAERVVVPIENLCEQVSIIETKALKSAGDRSLAQNVRISLLEAIGGPTEELLRGIELIRGQGDQRQDPKSSLIVLESLTDPVDEILVGLTRIEHELTTSESAESSLLRLEKPIALERMCRAVTRLGTNVEQITERKVLFGDESASCSVIERLQSAYQSLEAFLSTVPLNDVSGTLDNNVDTLVVETLVRPLEELSRVLDTFGTADVRTTSDRETVVSSLEISMSEMSTRLEALTAALEIYEKESGERGITELHADLVTFLRYTMDDAVERLEKMKLKKKRVTQETRVAEETGGVTPMIFDGKSSLDGDEGERASDSIVGSSETEESNVLQDIAQEAASIMKAVTVPSMSEAEAHVTPLLQEKSTKLEKSDEKSTTETDEEASVSKKERKKIQKREKSLEEKKQPRTPPQLDADLPLPEMLLDPLIEVQANLSDVISDFESQESAEESSLPGGSELAACLSELRECVATAAHTATTMKSANTVNALVDLREPLLDLQLAMASAVSPEEVKLIQEATVPLAELKVIVAAAIRSSETSEASQVQMRPVLRMLEDIEAEVSKHSEAEAISKSTGLSPASPEVSESRSVPQRPPEEVERAAVALTGVHFALSTALERGSAMALETTESLSLPGESELPLSARQTAEKSAASNLIASIEELRQCVGGLAVAIATPVVSTQSDEQYSYDILFDELAKLEEPLLNLQKVLLTEEHGPEDRHVLNDVSSPIRSLKAVVQDVTREIGGGSTPTVLELIEDVEKDVTLIAMEALKKALAGKSEGSVQDGQASVSSSSTPGEVPAIISKWLDPIEDWLTSTAEEGAEREESRAKSAIAPAVDDLKRELLKIAIQTSYSEPPSDVALIESLTELQEPLAKVCRVIAECHEPENLDIVEGLVQPTKHLLGTIFDASLTHEAGKVLRPVLEVIEELENQIPLTIKRATYERELQRVVRSMTPEETRVAEETPGTSGEVQRATSVESSEKLKIAAISLEVTGDENLGNLSQQDFELLQARARDPKPEATAEKIAEESKVTVQSSEEKSKAASAEVTGDENLGNLSQQDFELLQARARDPKPEASAEKIAEESKVAIQSSEEKSKAASAEVTGDENLRNLSQEDFELLQARARDPKPEASAQKIAEESKVAIQSSEERSKAASAEVTGEENLRNLSQEDFELLQARARDPKPEASAEKIAEESKVTVQSSEEKSKPATTQVTGEDNAQPPSELKLQAQIFDAEKSADEISGVSKVSLDTEKSSLQKMDLQINYPEASKPLETTAGTSAPEAAIIHAAEEKPQPSLPSETPEVITVDNRPFAETVTTLQSQRSTSAESLMDTTRADQLDLWTLTLLGPLDRLGNAVLSLDRSVDEEAHGLLCRPLDSLHKQIEIAESQFNRPAGQSLENDVETIIEGFLSPVKQLHSALGNAVAVWESGEQPRPVVCDLLRAIADSSTELCELLDSLRKKLVDRGSQQSLQEQQEDASLVETINAVLAPLEDVRNLIEETLKSKTFVDSAGKERTEDSMVEERRHGPLEALAAVEEIREAEEKTRDRDESAPVEQKAQSTEERELARASVAKSESLAAAASGEEKLVEEELDVLLGRESETAKFETAQEVVEKGMEENASIAKTDVAKTSRIGNKGKEESLDIEETTAKPLEELIEAIVDSSGPGRVSSSPEGYQSITPDISEDKSDTLIEEESMTDNELAKKGSTEVTSAQKVEETGIEEKKDKTQALGQAGLVKEEIVEGVASAEKAQKVVTEKLATSGEAEVGETSEAERKIEALRLAEAILDEVAEEILGEVSTDDIRGEKAMSLTQEDLAQAQGRQQKSLILETPKDSQEDVLGEDAKEIKPEELEGRKAELREGESLAEAGISKAPEPRHRAMDVELLETSDQESLKDISTQELEKQKVELGEAEGLAEAKITDAPEMRIKARDAEVLEASEEESLQEISTQELEKQKVELGEAEGLAEATITDAPEMRIKARDAEVLEPSEEESLQEISTQELEKQKGELREAEGLAKAKITDAPEMKVKARDAEISEASAEESLQEISTQELEKQKGELCEAEGLAKAKITDAPEMKIKARDAEISEASAEESLQEISTQELEKQKSELRETEGLAEAKITDAPEMRIKAKDAEISEASAEESLQEISTQELEKQKGELREAEGLAEAKITDAPEMRIKAKDAEISHASAEESLQEISTQELEKQKGELREAEGLAEAKITDAPEMRIKAKNAEISEASTEESLQEISTQELEKQKGELREAEGLAEAKITDAPEMRIKAKDAEISEASTEESLQEISTQELEKQKGELREAEGLAEAKITDAPEMRIKAKDAEISEASAEECLQEISTQELEKQKGELREGDSLAKAKVTDAPETMIKAKDAEISEASDQETLQEISTEELETLKGELREGESLAKAIVTDAPEMRIKAREIEISEASDDETLKEISTDELEKEQAELRESESLSKIKVTAAPETLKAADAQISETTEVAESVREMPKEVTEAQLQKASISAEEQRHTAEIATIRAAEVAKLDSVEIIEAAKTTIVEIVETPTQKTFKMQREGTSGEKPEDIVEKIVIKPVEDVVAMEDQQIVEIVETPTEKVIKVKLAVERSDGVVEDVFEEIVVKKPVEGWAKSLIEEGEQQAASVSQAKIQEFVSATITEEGVETHTSQQQRSVDKDSEEVGKKDSAVTSEETRESRKKKGEAGKKPDEDKLAEVQKEEAERSEKEAERLAREEQDRQEVERLKREESERLKREEDEKLRKAEADKIEKEESEKREMAKREAERLEREEAERLKRVEEERLRKEEAERLEREELERQEKVRQEAERLKREEAERLQREEEERLKREEAERLQREEEERLKRDEAERLQREEEERLKHEEAERLQREEEERLKREEAERLQREEEERLKREEAERLQREEEERLKREEAERLQREEEERLKREEAERLQREEEERLKREEAERLQREEEERLKREEAERLQREEEERLKREEAERLQRQEEDRLKREDAERLQREEEERLKREEAERLQREEEERLKREEAERLQREEEERLKREEAERLQREQEERLKREEAERLQREEEERLKREEAERLQREEEKRLKREEAERLQREEEERLKREEAERLQREEEEERLKREEAERLQREEEERLKREEAKRLQKEEEDRLKREEAERLQREEEERLKREEAERLQKEEEERRRKEEAERLRKEEADRLEKEELERKKQEAERVKKEEEERLKKEEAERLEKEELERKKQEEIDRAKKAEEERLKREEAERLEKEELERQKKEAERLKQEELDRAKKEEEERLKREEAERLEKEKLERQKQEELERTRKEEEERVKKEEDERLKQVELERKKQEELAQAKKAEDERLKQEELERKKQEELAQAKKAEEDRLKKEEAERLEKEELERKKQDAERVKQEELERAKKEEEERLKQEEAEKTKQKEIERKKQEESERVKKEQEEHLKQEEAERNKQEEAERVKQQELERAKKEEEEERLRKEKAAKLEQEEQNRKEEETERLKQEESERVKKEEEERLQKEESERKKGEAERLKQEELERAKKEEDERLKKEEEERLKKDEAAKLEKKKQETEKDETERSKKKERRRSSKKEAERLKGEEEERQRIEETERLENEKLQRDKEEAERLKNEELERQQKEVAERLKEEEQEHRRREEVERIEKEEMQREQDAEAERLRNKKELKRQQKEEAKRLKKEDSKEEAKRSSRKSQKDEKSKDTETAQIQAASSTRPEEQDDDKTPVNSEEDIREKANQRRVRVQEETEIDRDLRSSSTIRTDSEMDSEYSESSKSVVSRDPAVPARRRRSAQKQATEDDNDEVAKERLDRRGRDRPTIGRTREETLSSAEDKHYTPHYSATSRFQEFAPGPRDRGKKPSFCTKLTDRTAAEASRIKLTCAVLGDPEPQVYWTKDGRELPHSSNRHCTTEENGMISLELYAASPKDSGEYSCVAKNVHGQAHTEAKLKVYAGYEPAPAIPTFTRSIKDTYHSAENELVLECRVRGQPSPKITWLKDGQVLQIGDRYQQCDLGDGICRLKISNPDFYDGGLYTCRAENESKMSDRTSHVVNFEGKEREHSTGWRGSYRNLTSSDRDTGRPRFSSYLTDHSVPAGGTIALQVEVKGVPPPDVTWMRGDRREPIPAYKARTFADSGVYTLIVPEATESETGTYVCRASNAYGYVDTSANVEVVSSSSIEGGKPAMFVSRPAETMIHVTVGEDVSVSFRVNGVPKPRIIWMKGLRDITNGPRSYKESHDDYVRLTLKRALVSDEGTYCILAKNRYGCDRTFYTIKVKQRARSLTPSPDWGSLDTGNLLMDIHDTERSYLKQVPGAITSEPVVVDGGRNWLALSWGKAVQHGPAPVVAYRVDAWLLGGEGGARWAELGITPVNAFDAFNLRPGGEYKFRITPRNRYGWGDSVTMTNSVTVRGVVKFPEFSKILPGQLKALRGETLHLECEVRSETRAEVKWYRDTTDIDGIKDPRYMSYYNGTKSTLTVQAIKEHDSGRYVCEATNPAGRVSTFARVQVVTDPKIVEADEKLRRMRTLESSNEERPPEFTMRLRDRRVQMTYPVRLTCQVSGHPEPEVTWYKNREELFQDDNVSLWDDESHFHTLEISHSTIDDSGVYMAKARNVNGSVSCRCNLVVDKGIRAYVAPEFFRHLDAVYTIKSGGELRMTAQIEAYPTVGIVWHRDGHRLRPSRNAVMTLNHDGSVELSLAYVTLRDAGQYCCTATNEVGRAESTTRVTVLGADDEEAPSLTQSLPDVVESLDVPYSKEPLFVTKPLSTEAVEGDTVIILCEVVGDPKPEVIWLRDFLRPDYYRDAAHFRRIGAGPQYRLEIPYAKLDFTGAYSVIAKNCHGEAKAVISLQIYARGQGKTDSMEQTTIKHGNVQTLPSIKRPLRDLRCCDGDAVTLICRVHATPEPDVRWEKSGKLVPLGEDFAADFDGETARLSIQHVYPEDEGEYTCVAYNDLGKAFTSACLIVDVPEGKESALSRRLIRPVGLLSAESTPISTPRSTPVRSLSPSCVASRRELKPAVRTPRGQSIGRRPRLPTGPKFYAVPHNRVAEEGETVRFQCAVAGHPAPWVTWDKDGIPVTPTARISLKEKDDVRILEITEITHEDAGLYRITLENDVGRTEATARLEIIKGRHSSLTRTIRTRSASPRTYSIYSRSPITSAIRGDTHLRPNINDSMGGRGGTLSPTLPRWHHRNGKPPIESPEPSRKMNKRQITLVKSPLRNGVTPTAKADDQKTSLSSKPRSSSVPRQNTTPREIPMHNTKTRQTKASPVPRRTSEEKIRSNKNTTTPTTKTNGSMIPKRLPTARSRSPKLGNKIAVENPQVSVDSVDFSKTTTVSAVSVSEVFEETVKPVQSEETLEPEILRNLDDELSKTKSPQLEEVSPPRMSHDIPVESSKVNAEDKNEPRPPVIIAAPADVIALRGAKVMLLATFEGEPQPRVRWLRKGRDVRHDDRAEIETSRGLTCLTLDGVTTEQTGKYAVTLENNSGRDCRYVNVTVEGVPDPPAGTPCVQSITRAGKAIVTWRSPPYDGGCAVTGYSVEMKRGEEPCWIAVAEARHSLSHTVAGLDPEETYRFRVRAENAHGVSEPSTVSDVVTVPGEDDEEIGGQVFVAEINQIEIEEEEEEFEPAFEARIVSPEDGRQFEERYDVLEELGKGRYGIVRRIVEKSSGLNLAAKFVRTIKAKDRQQVHEEICVMNMLRHPKLLRLAAAFENPKEMIMVTEYISGGELFERVVADDFTLTEKDSIQFVKQICEGVEYMHTHSVVHLDLKPENIMCHTRTSHRIKLIDFGLAQTLKPDTPVRVLFGTPEFIPPEIIGFEPIGTESDMWSVGVICYVLLTGLSPFMGDNDAETFANITRAEYDFDDKAFTAISHEAKDFISALLIKRKESRMSAKQCLEHAWLAQRAESMSRVALPTDKLKKFIVRRKWQKTGNAIRALGRMAILSANSRRNLSAGSSPTNTEFGDELFADVASDVHGFKPIRPVVTVEDRTGSEYHRETSQETIEEEITSFSEEREESQPEVESKSSDSYSNGLHIEADCTIVSEVDIPQNPEESGLEENAPVIEEMDDLIHTENEEKRSDNSEAELCIEEISNESYAESDITTDLDAKTPSDSYLDDTTRKQSFSSFASLKITETGTTEVSSSLDVEESLRIETTKEVIEYDEINEEDNDKAEIMVFEDEILDSGNIAEDRDDSEGREATSSTPVVTKAWCKTNNPILVDEEDEVARLAGRGRSRHIVRTGSVSRTAKMFEKEEESNSSPARQQNPVNRTTPMVPEGRPQNERIRKAFAFWNK